MTREESQTISLLRFPMAIGIVAIHARSLFPAPEPLCALDTWQSWYGLANRLLTQQLAALAIPFFCFVSGYLFFQKLQVWDWQVYRSKLQRRVKTLVIPYLLWNLIAFVLEVLNHAYGHFCLGQSWSRLAEWYQAKGGILHMMWDAGHNYVGRKDWLGFDNSTSWPLCVPLWFVRDLIITTLLAPLFYWAFRKAPVSSMILLLLCCVSGVWIHISGFSPMVSFWFGLGACLAIRDVSWVVKKPGVVLLMLAVWLVWIMLQMADVIEIERHLLSFCQTFMLILGVFTVLAVGHLLVSRWGWKMPACITSACFFVYAFHSMSVAWFGSPMVRLAHLMSRMGDSYPALILRLLLVPLLTAACCVLLHYILKKLLPRAMAVLDGNR